MNTKADIETARKFLADNLDIEVVEALLIDLNGVHRGKWLPRHKLESDIWGRDVSSLCAKTGDGDGICVPTVRTLNRTITPFEYDAYLVTA